MTKEDTLVEQLAILVRRYPSREWLRLAAMLEDERARSHLVSLLKGLGSLPARTPRAKKRSKASSPKRVVRPEADSRERFELELSRSSISKLRHIAEGYGIEFSSKDSRERLRNMILSAAKRGDIKLGTGPESRPNNTKGDFATWADIIIKGRRPRG